MNDFLENTGAKGDTVDESSDTDESEASSEDPEGDKMSYQWSQISGNPVDLGTADAIAFDVLINIQIKILWEIDRHLLTAYIRTLQNFSIAVAE